MARVLVERQPLGWAPATKTLTLTVHIYVTDGGDVQQFIETRQFVNAIPRALLDPSFIALAVADYLWNQHAMRVGTNEIGVI